MNDDEKQKHYELAKRLISEQNFTAAVIVGAFATLLTAVAYGIAVETWPFSYGFAAVGVGTVIGVSIGYLGRGISMKFAVLATAYTIIGCILGNLFMAVLDRAKGARTSTIDVLRGNSLSTLAEWSVAGLTLIHLVFWFVAVFAAVFLARRSLSRSERLAIGMYQLRG